jgi:hypothetical protein
VRQFVLANEEQVLALPLKLLVQLAETLTMQDAPSQADYEIARRLYLHASEGFIEEREVRKVAFGLSKADDHRAAVDFLELQFAKHPERRANPFLQQMLGNAYIGLAKRCTQTARKTGTPPLSSRRAWSDSKRFLDIALKELDLAKSNASDKIMLEVVQKNIAFAQKLLSAVNAGERQMDKKIR